MNQYRRQAEEMTWHRNGTELSIRQAGWFSLPTHNDMQTIKYMGRTLAHLTEWGQFIKMTKLFD